MSTHDVSDEQLPEGSGSAAEVVARPAATVILMRDDPFEVLLLRRHDKSSFVPSVWVFPGGVAEQADYEIAQDLGDRSTVAAMRVCGARETFEETGIWLGTPPTEADKKRRRLLAGNITFRHLLSESPVDFSVLIPTARWITPVSIPKRFDTWFFLTAVGRDAVATVEQNESVDAIWMKPPEALSRQADGRMQMVFPTIKNLESIERFSDSASVLESRRDAVIEPILPRLVLEDGKKKLIL